jgi:hypothetical protein
MIIGSSVKASIGPVTPFVVLLRGGCIASTAHGNYVLLRAELFDGAGVVAVNSDPK